MCPTVFNCNKVWLYNIIMSTLYEVTLLLKYALKNILIIFKMCIFHTKLFFPCSHDLIQKNLLCLKEMSSTEI